MGENISRKLRTKSIKSSHTPKMRKSMTINLRSAQPSVSFGGSPPVARGPSVSAPSARGALSVTVVVPAVVVVVAPVGVAPSSGAALA